MATKILREVVFAVPYFLGCVVIYAATHDDWEPWQRACAYLLWWIGARFVTEVLVTLKVIEASIWEEEDAR